MSLDRSLRIRLKDFPQIPHSLRADPAINAPADICRCDLARLYHHYYLDSYGRTPPKPDPAQFEYLQFLADCDDFRLAGDGIGSSAQMKRIVSTKLGHAFCRWFLYEHLNVTYFAHMDKVLDRRSPSGLGDVRVIRTSSGDAPDYLCAENVNQVYLAEAKGRYTSVSFKNREFEDWREQFSRVRVLDRTGSAVAVKGFIVATRYATESNRSNLYSGIFAEDPDSVGERKIDDRESARIAEVIIADHYARILQKLDQSLIAAALASGTTLPQELQIQGTIWEMHFAEYGKLRFIGGCWPSTDGPPPFVLESGKVIIQHPNPFRLDAARWTFFGLEESVFRAVVGMARFSSLRREPIPTTDYPPFYSAISFLRDGSIIGPAEFFVPVGVDTY